MKKIILTLMVSLLLCGCGFHLRHHQAELSNRFPIIVLPPSGSNTFHQALHRALLSSSIKALEHTPVDSNVPQLEVRGEALTQFPLVYGPDGELRRERLKMAIAFAFHGPIFDKHFTLSTERDRQLNSKQHLGDNAEKILIEQEMQIDIISQLLRYLANNKF